MEGDGSWRVHWVPVKQRDVQCGLNMRNAVRLVNLDFASMLTLLGTKSASMFVLSLRICVQYIE